MSSNHTNTQGFNSISYSKDTFNFSLFKNAKATTKEKDIDVLKYLISVSDPARKEATEKLRALPAAEYKKAKIYEPCITGSGTTGKGRALEIKNGLAVVDFDILPNEFKSWQEFKEHLQSDSLTYIVHYSLSGNGLALFVKIPKANSFKEIYLSLSEYYDLMFGAKIDFLADESRLRFVAYDPQPFYNPNSEIYTDTLQQEETTEPTQQRDNDNALESFSNDPATAFNNSGLAGLEIINEVFESLGYTITAGKKPTIYEYQRAGGSLKSIAAFYNSDVVKFTRHSTNTGLIKEHYNHYELYKELKGFDHYTALKELANLGFGEWIEPQIIKSSSKESYSSTIDFLEPKNLKLNQLTGVVEITGDPINDTHTAQLITELSLLSGKNQSKDILQTCIDVVANKNQYHPFVEMVKQLEDLPATDFTRANELDKLNDCFTSSTPKDLRLIYLSRWMLGLFDLHIHNRMTKIVLILACSQNAGKTSFAKNILTEPLKQYGKVVEFNLNKMVDAKVILCSTIIAVFDEFEDILTKSKSLSDFKNLTSSYDILERRPFRRNPEQMFRSSIIMATTNEKSILNDPTGNTRFLTVDVQSFDFKKYNSLDMHKVWRVIYDLHRAGETSVLNEIERAMQAKENENFESEDFVCGLIDKSFYQDENGFITSTDILVDLEKNTKQHISIKRIGQALRSMGLERKSKRLNGKIVKGYNLKYTYED